MELNKTFIDSALTGSYQFNQLFEAMAATLEAVDRIHDYITKIHEDRFGNCGGSEDLDILENALYSASSAISEAYSNLSVIQESQKEYQECQVLVTTN